MSPLQEKLAEMAATLNEIGQRRVQESLARLSYQKAKIKQLESYNTAIFGATGRLETEQEQLDKAYIAAFSAGMPEKKELSEYERYLEAFKKA